MIGIHASTYDMPQKREAEEKEEVKK